MASIRVLKKRAQARIARQFLLSVSVAGDSLELRFGTRQKPLVLTRRNARLIQEALGLLDLPSSTECEPSAGLSLTICGFDTHALRSLPPVGR